LYHDSLNCNANMQVDNVDVSDANPVPVTVIPTLSPRPAGWSFREPLWSSAFLCRTVPTPTMLIFCT
jgi:hypothetical protein